MIYVSGFERDDVVPAKEPPVEKTPIGDENNARPVTAPTEPKAGDVRQFLWGGSV